MATPVNPLDVFVTYIPHYELHVSDNWDTLKEVQSVDANAVTTATHANNTLLINTRKDAHQQIDNVRFKYCSPFADPTGGMFPVDEITLEIIEPNGTSFIEKLRNKQAELKVKDINSGFCFGLKIFFVGRLADGSAWTIPFSKMLCLQVLNIEARYSHRGGEYLLRMMSSATSLSSTPTREGNGIARAGAFTNKNVSFKASTVQEAIKLLEDKLNKNYDDVYATELENTPDARRIVYKIWVDPRIDGPLTLVTTDSFAKGEKCQITFETSVDITTMIRTILTSSKQVNEMFGSSAKGVKVQMHPDVKLPITSNNYYLKPDVVIFNYRVDLYEGGGETFEFDYLFSGPGKNVDVIDFDMRFHAMQSWMTTTLSSAELNRNQRSLIPSQHPAFHASNNVHPDITREELYDVPITRRPIDADYQDVAWLPAVNRSENTGLARHEADATPFARLAFETIGNVCGATDAQLTFNIRGHLTILERLVSHPDGGSIPIGVTDGTWIKVNIFNRDGTPFFYTGKYILHTVENIFSGGKFTQLLTVMMMTP